MPIQETKSNLNQMQVVSSVAKGPIFRPQNLKGAVKKSEGPEKLAAEFLPNFPKKARKGAEFFKTSCLKDNLWIFRDECIFYPNFTHIFFI
jgi:hypothetical protein